MGFSRSMARQASGLTMLAAWIVSAVLMFQWFVSSGSSIAAQVFHLIFAPGMLVPFVMMNRIAGSPPLSDIVGTTILLLASIALVVWLSGRIFRVGILRTGQPPKLLELLRLARG